MLNKKKVKIPTHKNANNLNFWQMCRVTTTFSCCYTHIPKLEGKTNKK